MPGAFQSCELPSTTESSSAERKCWLIKKAGSFPCLPFSRRRQASTLALSSVCAPWIQKKSALRLIAKRAVIRSCLALTPTSLLRLVEARDARHLSPDKTSCTQPRQKWGVFSAVKPFLSPRLQPGSLLCHEHGCRCWPSSHCREGISCTEHGCQ